MALNDNRQAEREYCRTLLKRCPIPRDRLPYTPEFNELLLHFRKRFHDRPITENQFWLLLSSVAKQGGLSGKKAVPTASK